MRVQDLMTQNVATISPEASGDRAWTLMRARGIHHLVVTKDARILGVMSDRDAGGARGASLRKDRTVADLMTKPAVTVKPSTTVRKAANVMRGRSIGCLVVAEGGRAKGIVTVSDLLELVGRGFDRSVETTKRWTLRHRSPRRKASRRAGAWRF